MKIKKNTDKKKPKQKTAQHTTKNDIPRLV